MDSSLPPTATTNAETLRNEIGVLMQRFESEPEHVLQVTRLALQLFDGLAPWHQCGARDRLLLDAAACLHDIGWSATQPDGKGHHKESARMIREFPWTALTPAEVELVALVARYHRKAIPSPEHDAYSVQSPENQRRVRILAACLRIGDGLDRRHIQRVDHVDVRLTPGRLEIVVLSTQETAAELQAADAKADLLRQEFGNEVWFMNR
ncbi:MAG TPA: HD domain-containing protein [Candidatus Limnocylindria bacterium]|nr:HD domain-containing protein [Candidatus Limnocylindria bacterium]